MVEEKVQKAANFRVVGVFVRLLYENKGYFSRTSSSCLPPTRLSRKQKGRLTDARVFTVRSRQERALKIEDAKRFAFSATVNGAEFSQIEKVFLWNNILPPTKATFYNAQKELAGPIRARCETEVARRREAMNSGSIIAFDGPWNHRRQAKECIVVTIDYKITG
jgi:hypothetical protein